MAKLGPFVVGLNKNYKTKDKKEKEKKVVKPTLGIALKEELKSNLKGQFSQFGYFGKKLGDKLFSSNVTFQSKDSPVQARSLKSKTLDGAINEHTAIVNQILGNINQAAQSGFRNINRNVNEFSSDMDTGLQRLHEALDFHAHGVKPKAHPTESTDEEDEKKKSDPYKKSEDEEGGGGFIEDLIKSWLGWKVFKGIKNKIFKPKAKSGVLGEAEEKVGKAGKGFLRGKGFGGVPVVGGLIAGGLDYAEGGSVGHAMATGAGAVVGQVLGALTGFGVGEFAGGIGGAALGGWLYDKIFGSNQDTQKIETPEILHLKYDFSDEIKFKAQKIQFKKSMKDSQVDGGGGTNTMSPDITTQFSYDGMTAYNPFAQPDQSNTKGGLPPSPTGRNNTTSLPGKVTPGPVTKSYGTQAQRQQAVDDMIKMEGLSASNPEQAAMLRKYMKDGGVGLDPAQNAWCAAFTNAALAHAGIKGSGSNMASSFINWGNRVAPGNVQKGDVVYTGMFGAGSGHVGIATGNVTDRGIEVEGGNTGGAVRKFYVPPNFANVRRAADPPVADIPTPVPSEPLDNSKSTIPDKPDKVSFAEPQIMGPDTFAPPRISYPASGGIQIAQADPTSFNGYQGDGAKRKYKSFDKDSRDEMTFARYLGVSEVDVG